MFSRVENSPILLSASGSSEGEAEITSVSSVNKKAGINVVKQMHPILSKLRIIINGDKEVTLCPMLQRNTLPEPKMTKRAMRKSQFTMPFEVTYHISKCICIDNTSNQRTIVSTHLVLLSTQSHRQMQ